MSVGGNIRCEAVAVVALRPDADGARVLLLKRNGGSLSDHWSQVTGGRDPGETLWQAALRELREETQMVPDALYSADYIDRFYNAVDDVIDMVPVFVAVLSPEADVVLNEEHSEYRWLTLSEARAAVPFEGHRQALDVVERDFVKQPPADWKKIWPEYRPRGEQA